MLSYSILRERGALVSFLAAFSGVAFLGSLSAQTAVTAVHTDFGGYWTSGLGSLSATLPNDHHHLLAFEMGGTTYSTGVSDSTLDANAVTYTAANFQALNITELPSTGGASYLVFQGAVIDGDGSGAGAFTAPADSSEIAGYLTDGANGMDFGTGVANIPTDVYEFSVSNLQSSAINDNVPDILVTQMAEISASKDSICFLDGDGLLVGAKVAITWASVGQVGTWSADFWTMDGSSHSTNASKPIRAAGLDFNDLSLTAGNIDGVETIRIEWSGSSDPAFFALNAESFGAPCEDLAFSSLSLVSAASSPSSTDGIVSPSIASGNEPYSLVSIFTGDTLTSSQWDMVPSGRYTFKALDSADCLSTNSFTVAIPYRSCQ